MKNNEARMLPRLTVHRRSAEAPPYGLAQYRAAANTMWKWNGGSEGLDLRFGVGWTREAAAYLGSTERQPGGAKYIQQPSAAVRWIGMRGQPAIPLAKPNGTPLSCVYFTKAGHQL